MQKRIVITGMGILTALGDNLNEYYNNLIAGKSGISQITSINTENIECKIGGDLGKYDFKLKFEKIKEKLPEKNYKKLKKISKNAPLSTKLTLLSSIDAFNDAGLFKCDLKNDRISLILGGNNFHDNYIVSNILQFQEEPEYIAPLAGLLLFDTDTVASISEILEIKGPINTVGGACAGSAIALRDAINLILLNECDIALTGGGVLDYSHIGLHAMSMLNALGFRNYKNQPEKASRPFDKNRNGFLFSHGTGMIVIESYENALRRNAKIYAEILGVHSNSDANHLPNPDTNNQTKLLEELLEKSNIKKEKIDFISAHATSTKLGDISEINAIKNVFKNHAYNIKINAPKSLLGHTGWASHTVELIAGIMQMNNSRIHSSINIDELDPEIDLDVCKDGPKNINIDCFLNNSFGIGGINCCSVIKKVRRSK